MSARVFKITIPALVILTIFVGSNAQVQERFANRPKVMREGQPAEHDWADSAGFRRLPTTGHRSDARQANFLLASAADAPPISLELKLGETTIPPETTVVGKSIVGVDHDHLTVIGEIKSALVGRVQVLPYDPAPHVFDGTNTTVTRSIDIKELLNRGEVTFELVYTYVDPSDGNKQKVARVSRRLAIDTRGPVLERADLFGDVNTSPTLVLTFEYDDLNPATVQNPGNFTVVRLGPDRKAEGSPVSSIAPIYRGDREVHMPLPRLADGTYSVTIKKGSITDLAGNVIEPEETTREFAIRGRSYGKNVEFPEFLPVKPSPAKEINPGDKVVTKVVRLYYFRDAHRVAQLINRTTRSLNHAAVSQAQRRAEHARTDADSLTDERRANERAAVQAAVDLRRVENEIASLRGDEQRSRQLTAIQKTRDQDMIELEAKITANDSEITRLDGEISTLADQIDELPDEENAQAQAQLEGLKSDQERLKAENVAIQTKIRDASNEIERIKIQINREGLAGVDDTINRLETQAASLRAAANRTNEAAIQAQAKEDRAREKQFRLEVASAHEDPDTYAAGTLNSVDPVAQVSVSVIGTGLLQLRGPQKGVNTIRTMVHQIDAPVGQVKVDIATVQMNGERGEKLERAVTDSEAYVDLGRFLTSQSLLYLRQAISQEAYRIADENEHGQHFQVDRDRKYLYHWFGRDFIDELYSMDSEFLNSENKLLSLHSMDTISLHRALFVLALAKNDVRQNVLAHFSNLIQTELPQAEFDFRRASELRPHRTHKRLAIFNHTRLPLTDKRHTEQHIQEAVFRNAAQRYHFRNFHTFFGGGFGCGGTAIAAPSDSMNPVQREFIRLAQIFKARLITELELKQRIIERTMLEDHDRLKDIADEEAAKDFLRASALAAVRDLQEARINVTEKLAENRATADALVGDVNLIVDRIVEGKQKLAAAVAKLPANDYEETYAAQSKQLLQSLTTFDKVESHLNDLESMVNDFDEDLKLLRMYRVNTQDALILDQYLMGQEHQEKHGVLSSIAAARTHLHRSRAMGDPRGVQGMVSRVLEPSVQVRNELRWLASPVTEDERRRNVALNRTIKQTHDAWRSLKVAFDMIVRSTETGRFKFKELTVGYGRAVRILSALQETQQTRDLREIAEQIYVAGSQLNSLEAKFANANLLLKRSRTSVERRKLLNFLIEEQEERLIDLLEGTRQQIATVDNYLKRLSTALEDDFKIQFYEPSFIGVRNAARRHHVTLSSIERTSVLTNNRALAKVLPTATMEFDLPKRKIAVVEAFEGAKALASDYGALLQDPTFLAAFQLMGGAAPNGTMQNVLPGMPSTLDEYQMGLSQGQDGQNGSALEGLIPDPSIYKIETGTGYEIRPVIQPDGDSIVYDFNYMYTTEVREPVRADEKHLGRVKRHFLSTQVQTSSYELREVSRYQVALKVARTGQGVPLLQDIPVVGVAFRPLPSAESSIQQNIILGKSVVYPTLFDLMGLRWAPSVVDLNHTSVQDAEHIVRGRRTSLEGSVYDITTKTIDDILGVEIDTPEHHRPDLYHRQRQPSPYHPGGYTYPELNDDDDPSGRGFERRDRRPQELREPLYDPKHRRPMNMETVIEHGLGTPGTETVIDGSYAPVPNAPFPNMEVADPY